MITYECRGCREPLQAPESFAGCLENCPKCGRKNRIPLALQRVKERAAVRERQAVLDAEAGILDSRLSIICPNPNCGYRGAGQPRSRGNILSALILLWLGIVPGLIYVAWFYGGDLLCPHCGGKARDIPHELACELARDPSGQSIVPRQRQAGILVAIVAALALALAAVAILAAMRHF